MYTTDLHTTWSVDSKKKCDVTYVCTILSVANCVMKFSMYVVKHSVEISWFIYHSDLQTAVFCCFRGCEFCHLVNFCLQKVQKIHRNRNSVCVKMADFALLEFQKLISRKIRVIENNEFSKLCQEKSPNLLKISNKNLFLRTHD